MTEENVKNIYNLFLITTKKQQNKPFKIRKNFKGFEETSDYIHVKKIERIFNSLPQINREWYFKAPFDLYKEQKYFGLDFYATQRAIKAYTLYVKAQRNKDPDNPDILQFIADSFKFILGYCKEQNISLNEYATKKDGLTFAWQQHLKEYKVSIYSLIELDGFIACAESLPDDEKDIFLGEMAERLYLYKKRLRTSQKAYMLVKKIMKLTNK